MFQTKFNTALQMLFIKLNMIFFQKPPKTLNICIFPCKIRYLWFKYFLTFGINTGMNQSCRDTRKTTKSKCSLKQKHKTGI